MNTLRLVLPTVLLLYVLWRSMRQRVFLLGLPFLMDMYFSVFFDRLKLFWVPGSWEVADHMMFWLVAVWVVYFDLLLPRHRRSVGERRLFGPRLSAPEEIVLVGFAAYMLFRVGATATHYMDLGTAIGEARVPLYVFAGYFLLRGIFAHAGREETLDFVAAIVVINTVAAGLYVLHQGLRLYIYAGVSEYLYIVFNGEVLTRSFYFMPQYLPLAVAFCAARRTWSLLWLGVLTVTLAAIWVSYTRALVLVAVVEIATVLVVRLLKRRDAWPAARRLVQIALVTGAFVVAAFTLLPTQSAYIASRLTETQAGAGAVEDGNLQQRITWWRVTNEWVGEDDRLLGVGFPSLVQDARVTQVEYMAPDLVWVPTLWNLGLLGVVGLAAMFIAFGWRAASMSLASEDDAAFLSITLLGVIVGVFLLGFVEWTIFDPWHTPLALSFLALLTAERCRQRAEARASTADMPDSVARERAGGHQSRSATTRD